MKTALATTICELYESQGLTPDQISEVQSVEKPLVVATLLSFSPKFRDAEKGEEKEQELVSKSELKEFIAEYKTVARYTDDQHLKAKMLQNLINVGLKVTEGIGVNDPKKLLKEISGTGNIYNLNMVIQQARAAKAKIAEKVNNVLDVETTAA